MVVTIHKRESIGLPTVHFTVYFCQGKHSLKDEMAVMKMREESALRSAGFDRRSDGEIVPLRGPIAGGKP